MKDNPSPYSNSPSDVLSKLDSSSHGLEQQEAQRRLQEFGHNLLPEANRQHWISRFIRQFNNVLIYVLIGATIITALLGLSPV